MPREDQNGTLPASAHQRPQAGEVGQPERDLDPFQTCNTLVFWRECGEAAQTLPPPLHRRLPIALVVTSDGVWLFEFRESSLLI